MYVARHRISLLMNNVLTEPKCILGYKQLGRTLTCYGHNAP